MVDKLRGKSDVYLASTFSPINNSTFLESSLSLSLSPLPPPLPFHSLSFSSSIIPAAQWMNRADSRERFFAYQTGVHYSHVCETRPGFTILICPVIGFMHVRRIDRSSRQVRPRPLFFTECPHTGTRAPDHCSLYIPFFIFHTLFFLFSFLSLAIEYNGVEFTSYLKNIIRYMEHCNLLLD